MKITLQISSLRQENILFVTELGSKLLFSNVKKGGQANQAIKKKENQLQLNATK